MSKHNARPGEGRPAQGAKRGLRSRGKWLVAVLVAAAVTGGVWLSRPIWLPDPGGQESQAPSRGAASPPRHEALDNEAPARLKREAISVAEELLRSHPENGDVLALMGNVYWAQGNTAQAVANWEKCLKRNPDRADPYQGMARIAQEKGEHERAEMLWREALEREPGRPGLREGLALALLAQAKPGEAADVLEHGTRARPDSAMLHFLLGQSRLQLQQLEAARRSYEAAIRHDPELTGAHYGMATVCARLGDGGAARNHMERFRELKKKDMELLKDRNSARDDLMAVRQAVAETHTMAGGIHAQLGNPGRAEELWLRAASLNPRNVPCRIQLAGVYQRADRLEDALRVCRELRALEPGNLLHLLNAGLLSARLGRFEDAERAYEDARSLAPENPWPCRDLARLYLSTNRQLPRARELAKAAVDLQPNAQNYFVLGWACDRTGDLPGARAALRRAVELAPDNVEYRRKYELLEARK